MSEEALSATYDASGAPIVPARLAWARSYLKHAGLVTSAGNGIWAITEAGRAALTHDDHALRRLVSTAYKARAGTSGKAADGDASADLSSEASSETLWAADLLSVLGRMAPDAFERLCQRVLREAGFTKVQVTGKSGDGGIDGIGVLRVRLVSFQILFQCKRWKGSVGSSVVRDFRGAMVGRADKGLIMTTGTFTADARREATRDGAPAIDLVDGDDLCNLLKELKIGVSVRLVEEVEIDERVFAEI